MLCAASGSRGGRFAVWTASPGLGGDVSLLRQFCLLPFAAVDGSRLCLWPFDNEPPHSQTHGGRPALLNGGEFFQSPLFCPLPCLHQGTEVARGRERRPSPPVCRRRSPAGFRGALSDTGTPVTAACCLCVAGKPGYRAGDDRVRSPDVAGGGGRERHGENITKREAPYK